MIRNFTLGFMLLVFTPANCQQIREIIFLQNGSIIKGSIIEEDENFIKVETCCGSLFVFKRSEISNIEPARISDRAPIIRDKGFLSYYSTGILLGSSVNAKQAPLSILTEFDYRFIPYFAAGISAGYEALNESTIPLAVNLKALYPLATQTLFFGISGGYNFSVENPDNYIYEEHNGGGLFTIEAGIQIHLSNNNGFFIAAGYRYNELHYKVMDWWIDSVHRTIYFNRFSFRLGFVIF